MEYIILSINLLMPMILLVAIGYFLKRRGLINEDYEIISSKLVFKLALPVTLFTSTASSDISAKVSKEIWVFLLVSSVMLVSLYIIAHLISLKLTDDKRIRGAFIQGAYRSNYVIIGYPILLSLFGDEVMLPMSLLTIFLIPIFNTLAVISLTINNPEKQEVNIKEVAFNVITNPLIFSIILGLLVSVIDLRIPVFLSSTFDLVKGLTTPLALINIGSMFVFNIDLKNRIPLFTSVLLKTVIYPLVFTSIAIILGFRDHLLGIIFIAIATPAPPSSYVMAKLMNSDDVLAAGNVVLSTSFSAITIFIGIFILKSQSLI